MTIFKVNSDFIYFSHIPKCAGSSIEDYFSTFSECSILFLDRDFYTSSLRHWTKSSPQHIPGNVIERLFDNSFFTNYFSIIREPIDRFKSSFNFQKYWLKNIEEEMDPNFFISEILPKNYQKQGWCDNHFQTQISFLIPNRNYKLFLMNQEGIRKAKKYIDQNIFKKDKEKDIPRNNTANELYSKKVEDIELNSKSIEVIKEIYKLDFNLFKELNKKNTSSEKSFFVFSNNNFEIFNKENFLLKNQELRNKNEELLNKNEELLNKNEELRNKNEELKKILFSIQESRIWRYSYQFRRVMDKLRNSRN